MIAQLAVTVAVFLYAQPKSISARVLSVFEPPLVTLASPSSQSTPSSTQGSATGGHIPLAPPTIPMLRPPPIAPSTKLGNALPDLLKIDIGVQGQITANNAYMIGLGRFQNMFVVLMSSC